MKAPMHAQRGVVLFIALIILVAMSLAGVALMRSIDTGTVIAGNLAFRQNSTYVGDIGVEAARAWLNSSGSGTTLDNDVTASAYYATWGDTVDLLGNDTNAATTPFDWSANSFNVTASPYTPPTGYTVRYVIQRLCRTAGSPSAVNATCIKASTAGSSTATGSKGAATYGGYALAASAAATYRITVQVTGPRNTRSYVQATVN